MGTMIQPFHQRLAELWTRNKCRPLTPEEMSEVQHCLAANTSYCWEMAHLENLSLMASLTNDVDWQHEVCRDIDELQANGGIQKKKKSARKKRETD